MTSDSKHDAGMAGPTGDDTAVQNELRREESERAAIGDTASDRNLTGSSSWLTLPDAAAGLPAADLPGGGPSVGRGAP